MKLKREFYNRPTLNVAKNLLGKKLVHLVNGEKLVSKIVEVEAYIGAIDKAAHCYNNKVTKRTKIMFGPPGYAYVYLIYGMYNCMNIVTEAKGEAAAVLIRAVEPLEGKDTISHNRYNKAFKDLTKKQIINLTSGPGKLCIAMNITKDKNNNMDLCNNTLWVEDSENNNEYFKTVTSKRINIDYAEEAIDFPWRFYIKDNPYISKK